MIFPRHDKINYRLLMNDLEGYFVQKDIIPILPFIFSKIFVEKKKKKNKPIENILILENGKLMFGGGVQISYLQVPNPGTHDSSV